MRHHQAKGRLQCRDGEGRYATKETEEQQPSGTAENELKFRAGNDKPKQRKLKNRKHELLKFGNSRTGNMNCSIDIQKRNFSIKI
jgi:hypothetical protein